MEKRMVVLVLGLAMVFSLAACGSAVSNDAGSGAEETEGEEAAAQSEGEDTGEITIIDNDYCSMILTDYSETSDGISITAEVENKTSDMNIAFEPVSGSVNGAEVIPYYYVAVAAGKKSVDTIGIDKDDIDLYGITDYTDICIRLKAYDNDDWSADYLADETVHIYPYGEDAAVKYERKTQKSDVVMVDNDYVTVVVTGYNPDGMYGYEVELFIVNKTDAAIMVSADNVSVNGYMADPYYASSVPADCCACSTLYWDAEEFEDYDIDNVEEIEMTISAYNDDDWSMDDYFSEIVTLNP